MSAPIRWCRTDSFNFFSFALGMLAEAYAFGAASVAAGWFVMPKFMVSLLLVWAPIWLMAGIAIAGPLSDRIGRRRMFYLTMAAYALGALGLAFSFGYAAVLAALAVMLLAAGGEMNTILVASHELMPPAHRGKATMAAVNFVSLGGLVLAIAAFSAAYQQVAVQREVVGLVGFGIVASLLVVRGHTPESLRWLRVRDPVRAQAEALTYYGAQAPARLAVIDAEHIAQTSSIAWGDRLVWLKLFCSIAMAFGDVAGFGMITYVVGPYFFKSLTAGILLVASLAAVLSGLAFLLGDRVGRRFLLLGGYAGCMAISLGIWFAQPWWLGHGGRFLALVFALNIVINVAYMAEDTFKAEIWPTALRGRMTALVRFTSIGLYGAMVLLTQHLAIADFLALNTGFWGVGLLGALVWFGFGRETGGGVSLGVASGEVSDAGLPHSARSVQKYPAH
ncbi:MAG TPA: MFS transporter [Acidiphilium sp.]|nr:MFS transporter [Acidiphilium sp.]HQU24495.1 MFS transporter [Acidiphilium sp.]